MSEQTETKNEKFKRLATKRVQNAIAKVELVGNLASPSYEYSAEEVEKILAAMQETLDKVKAAFSKQGPTKKEFNL